MGERQEQGQRQVQVQRTGRGIQTSGGLADGRQGKGVAEVDCSGSGSTKANGNCSTGNHAGAAAVTTACRQWQRACRQGRGQAGCGRGAGGQGGGEQAATTGTAAGPSGQREARRREGNRRAGRPAGSREESGSREKPIKAGEQGRKRTESQGGSHRARNWSRQGQRQSMNACIGGRRAGTAAGQD